MSIRRRLLRGGLYGLIFGTTLFLAEGCHLALGERDIGLWTVPFNVGVGAPLVLTFGLTCALLFAAWMRALSSETSSQSPGELVWTLVWASPVDKLVTRSAWLIAGAVLTGLWSGVSVLAATKIAAAVATPLFADILLVLVQLTTAVILAASSALIALPVQRLLKALSSLGFAGRLIVRPLSILTAGGLVGILGLSYMWLTRPDTMSVLPWTLVVGPVMGVVAAATLGWLIVTRTNNLARVVIALTAIVAALGVFTLFLPMKLEGARAVFVGQQSFAGTWFSTIHPRLDFDGDGSLFFYAGGDCAPFDASRGPHQREIIGDGIDQNCSGSDLVVDPDEFKAGTVSHGRPEGMIERPNIILITSDALSHSHTTMAGYHRDTTPNLAAWAARATTFESAFSLSTSTRLAMPGLLASMFNSQMPMKDGRRHPYHYAPEAVTIPTMLKELGYRTIHIPGNRYFINWRGYWRGFDLVDTKPYETAKDKTHTSPELTAAALEYLDEHDPKEGPLFLWVHYYDHHAPYKLPKGGKVFGDGTSKVDRFDSELHFADSQWVALLNAVEAKWSPDEYLMIFTSDHGEAFDENHVREHHDFSVFTAPTHIPLIIQGPEQRGARVTGLTGHVDVLPTLADILDYDPLDDWRGESLVPVLFEGKPVEKTVMYSLFYIPEAVKRDEDGFQMIGVRTPEWYYFENRLRGERRLVRWREDPIDAIDLRREHPDKAEVYRYVATDKLEWLREHERGLTKPKK